MIVHLVEEKKKKDLDLVQNQEVLRGQFATSKDGTFCLLCTTTE